MLQYCNELIVRGLFSDPIVDGNEKVLEGKGNCGCGCFGRCKKEFSKVQVTIFTHTNNP